MIRSTTPLIASCALALAIFAVPAPLAAQDSVVRARDLYSAAEYEDALAVLNRLRTRDRSEDDSRTIEQYRAFCLLALGRVQEADQTIEGIVAAQPLYFPSPSEVSPRVRAAFTDVRRRMLPSLVQQKYAQAKAAYDRKDYVTAEAGFRLVLNVLADPDLAVAASQPPLSDLRTVTSGFHDLSAAAAAPPPPPPAPVPAQPPPVAPAPAPAASVSMPSKIYSLADAGVVPPVALKQVLPVFPRDNFPTNVGVLEVIIDATGAVESAAMRASVKPTYDGLAVAAAKNWRYTPAMLDGRPVRFRKLIQVNLDTGR